MYVNAKTFTQELYNKLRGHTFYECIW